MSESTEPDGYPISFEAKGHKVIFKLRGYQCTVEGEAAAVKIAHDLMAVAEKALKGKISEK